mmetsp:Transcript_5351/g.16870  ORF Transcript_5351/g.16870 Transcript_5351/m.16870 type:complete len:572 (-) Transcript_5351:142-1857(-)
MSKRLHVSSSNLSKRAKTAIEQEMEEAEEYERRKETEQRKAQHLKLMCADDDHPTTTRAIEQAGHAIDHIPGKGESRGERGRLPGPRPKQNLCSNVTRTESPFNRTDLSVCPSHLKDAAVVSREMLGKLRLPRSLLEKWVEEPFFEKAVVGCFVRLGVGKASGALGEAQYKVCEIVSVGKYKHAYTFGEFETTKALMLRIGRNERLWRMNVISNHRFTDSELEEWSDLMRAEQQQMPSASEIDERKARMRKAVFGQSAGSQQLMTDQVASGDGIGQKSDFNWKNNKESATTYSEADVARIVSARRKRSEAARFRERQAETVTRLNHGQTRTRYEHEVCSTRDAYAALLVTQSKSLLLTPLLAAALQKVEQADTTWQLADGRFKRDLDLLASRLAETRRAQIPDVLNGETEECRKARVMHRDALQRLTDFQKNALDQRKKRDANAPSRTSTLHSMNEAKKYQNALADIAYGEKKIRDEPSHDSDADHIVFQRRATKPTMLWTTKPTSVSEMQQEVQETHDEKSSKKSEPTEHTAGPDRLLSTIEASVPQPTDSHRQRKGMSLKEYLQKARSL